MRKSPAEFMRFTAPDRDALVRAIEDARSKLIEAEAGGDKAAMLDHAASLGGMLTTARNEVEAEKLLRRHESLAENHAPVEQLAWFWNALATALQYLGSREAADVYFDRAVEAARSGGWRLVEAMALHHWGRNLVEQGHFSQAQLRIEQALAIRQELNEPRQESSRKALQELAKLRAAGDA